MIVFTHRTGMCPPSAARNAPRRKTTPETSNRAGRGFRLFGIFYLRGMRRRLLMAERTESKRKMKFGVTPTAERGGRE